MGYFVEVYESRGPGERHELQLGERTIGGDPGDTVRLSARNIAGPRALKLTLSPGGLLVVSRDSAAKFVWDGQALGRASLEWGSEVYLGQTRLVFVKVDPKETKRSPLVPVAALCAMAVTVALIGGLNREDFSTSTGPQPPALTQGESESCDTNDKEAAGHQAIDNLLLAEAKGERYPFERQDGLEALRRYRKAAACFSTAGLSQQSAQAEMAKSRWELRLQGDLRDLRLRLDLALRAKDWPEALRTIRAIESMTWRGAASSEGEYAKWLKKLSFQLETRIARK